MSNKLVSVCINAYNAEKYILKTLESAINQTHKNLQIIVVDDCSTDNTYDIIKSVNDERIEVYKTPFNGHMSFACNEALKHAKGDYIAHLDADDLWAEDKIEKQVAFLEGHHEYGACFTHAEIIDEIGNICDNSQDSFRQIFALENRTHSKTYRFFFDNSNWLCHSSVLIKSDIVEKVGPYDTSMLYLQDFDYWMRALTFSPIYVIPEQLTLYRVSTDSNSGNMDSLKWNSHNTEFARLIYKSINLCPDNLFLEAFADKLKLQGAHTHEETELEKAFLLTEGPLIYKGNPVLGLYKFSELFKGEGYIRLARERFNFTTRNLYEIQTKQAYFDPAKTEEILNSLKNTTAEKERLSEISQKQQKELATLHKTLGDLNTTVAHQNATIEQLQAQAASYQNSFLEIQNSFYWRLTAPARKLTQKFKNVIARNKNVLNVFIFLKGFLRGGIKEGLARVRRLNNHPSKNPSIKISNKQRKSEVNYNFEKSIKFSILVPLYNTPKKFLIEMIDSVKGQTYSNWELCLADGSDKEHSYVGDVCKALSKQDKRIVYKKLSENKGISENTNECIDMATGDYIALFDHDDLLHPSALFEMMKAICDKSADMVYTDEVTFRGTDTKDITVHNYKPDYSPDTLRSYNYICHFTAFSKELLQKSGGYFNSEYDGSQDYDLILRLTENAKNIIHIPKALYFWRSHQDSTASDISAKPYVVEASKRALTAHLERLGLKGHVENATALTTYKIQYDIIGNPLVSVIIPNKDHVKDLDKCLTSIYTKSTYKNLEIIIVENNSTEDETFDYYKRIESEHNNIRVIKWDSGFNYSAINNFAAKQANGEYILLLNNDIEIITPDWLEQMLMFAQRKDVGAVGAKLYYPNDTIQHAGVILGIGGVAGHSHKYFNRYDLGYMGRASIAQNLSACTAACLLIRKDVFDEVEGLDENYAVAFNDVDLCMKIREADYLIVFTPFAEFYHHESISRGLEDTPEKQARFNSEVDLFYTKWDQALKKGDPYYNPNLTLEFEDFSLR